MAQNINSETEKLNTIIGQDTVLRGECTVKGTVRVDGIIDGTLTASGMAILGKSGQIKGDLLVGNAIIGGVVDGSVIAKNRLELQTGARVEGDITARKLVVEEGVFFQGYCKMKQPVSEKGKKAGKEEDTDQIIEKRLDKLGKVKEKEQIEEASTDDTDEEITFHGEPV